MNQTTSSWGPFSDWLSRIARLIVPIRAHSFAKTVIFLLLCDSFKRILTYHAPPTVRIFGHGWWWVLFLGAYQWSLLRSKHCTNRFTRLIIAFNFIVSEQISHNFRTFSLYVLFKWAWHNIYTDSSFRLQVDQFWHLSLALSFHSCLIVHAYWDKLLQMCCRGFFSRIQLLALECSCSCVFASATLIVLQSILGESSRACTHCFLHRCLYIGYASISDLNASLVGLVPVCTSWGLIKFKKV